MNKKELSKPFRKAMKQAERVSKSSNNPKEIHRLCILLKDAIGKSAKLV